MLLLMLSYDAGTIIDSLMQLITVILITLPGNIISSTLSSGILRTIWVSFFGNAQVVRAAFIFALVGGFYFYSANALSNSNRRSKM